MIFSLCLTSEWWVQIIEVDPRTPTIHQLTNMLLDFLKHLRAKKVKNYDQSVKKVTMDKNLKTKVAKLPQNVEALLKN